jgi:hypothetical protein
MSREESALKSLNEAGHGFMHEMVSHGCAEAGVTLSLFRDSQTWSHPLHSRSMMQF